MTKELQFYATSSDLPLFLAPAEESIAIDYIRMANEPTPTPQRFQTYRQLPKLGLADAESTADCPKYLVIARNEPVAMREVRARDGTSYFKPDQLVNPRSVTFTAGGLDSDGVLLMGRVATVSAEIDSETFLNAFGKHLERQFTQIRNYWVGPAALKRLDAGKRLTASAKWPLARDLTR